MLTPYERKQRQRHYILYRMFDTDGNLLYLGRTTNLPLRIEKHRSCREWWSEVATITLEHLPGWHALCQAEMQALIAERPPYDNGTVSRRLEREATL